MNFKSDIFNVEYKEIDGDNYIHIINIEKIDQKLKLFIDKNIVTICEGTSDTDCGSMKRQLIDFLDSKKGSNIETGAIAEFFIHLYLNDLGFKQEFLFLNLEEGSMKKGFDGYYSFKNEEWLLESKSGQVSSLNISHHSKIKEAYDDLSDKVSGKGKTNNPWRNAYNHADLKSVDCSDSIRKNIKKLSNEFKRGVFHGIEDFNIMPGSTIFLEGAWVPIDAVELEKEIRKLITRFKFKKINIICINKKSVDLFLDYLSS